MSLNKELQDFLGAFKTVDSLATSASKRDYYKNKGAGGNSPTNPSSPAGVWVNGQAGGMPPGSATPPMFPGQSQPGALQRADNWIGRQFGAPAASSAGAVPAGAYGGDPSSGGGMPPDPVNNPMETYADGGDVELPPYEPYPGQRAAQAPVAPAAQEPPVALPATPPPPRRQVTSEGKRKALDDQTRTEAYDPGQDGPGAVPVAPAPQAVASSQGAVPLGAPATQSPDMQGDAAAGLSTNDAHLDLERALHGGMTFAQNTFHLNPADPHYQGGTKALFSGVGAATPDVVKAMDQHVNANLPNDPNLYNVRRLEAVYRWYSMNGETDKANKAAFELMQYSAGVASQWGARAVDQYKSGDAAGAVKSIQEGYNHIPDGNHMDVKGNTATIVDKRTGQPVQQFQFTPEEVFNAAMGLSNRSLYWQVLGQRVGQTQKGTAKQLTPEQEELQRARIENIKARTDRLKRTPIKGTGGAGGQTDATKALIDKINAEEGGTPASPKANTAAEATPVSEPAEPADSDVNDDGGTFTEAGGKPTQTTAGEPDLAAPDRVPDDVQIAHDGTKYVSPKATAVPDQFSEEAPKPSPYGKYAADVAKLPPKERIAVSNMLKAKQSAYDKNTAGYNSRKKTFEQGEKHRVEQETKAAQTDLAKSMSGYDQTFKGQELNRATTEVKEAFDGAVKAAPYGGQSFDDLNSTEAKKALADNAADFKTSIFSDKQVPQDKLRSMAFSLMTSNPNMTADRAVRMVQQLTTIDPVDATKRVYKPVGRDVTASKNVVLQPAESAPYKFGPVHMRQDAYDDLASIVQGRLKRAAAVGKQGALGDAEKAGGPSSADVVDKAARIVDSAKPAIKRALTFPAAKGRTLIDDIREAAPKVGNAVRGAVVAIPAGNGEVIQNVRPSYPAYDYSKQGAVPVR